MKLDPDTLVPPARGVYDRYQIMIDQGKVCPLCGAPLEIRWPCVGGEHNGELFITIECSLRDPHTGEVCDWYWEPADELLISESFDYEIDRACDLHGGCCCCET